MFTSTLARIVGQVDHARGAAVMNLEGLTIDAVGADGRPTTPDEASTEYASVFDQINSVSDTMGLGAIAEFTVDADGGATLFRMLSARYLVALKVGPEAVQGKARHQLRLACPELARQL